MAPCHDDPRYTLTELADLAGVTARTVRYYISQGLLPSAGRSGPGAKYDDDAPRPAAPDPAAPGGAPAARRDPPSTRRPRRRRRPRSAPRRHPDRRTPRSTTSATSSHRQHPALLRERGGPTGAERSFGWPRSRQRAGDRRRCRPSRPQARRRPRPTSSARHRRRRPLPVGADRPRPRHRTPRPPAAEPDPRPSRSIVSSRSPATSSRRTRHDRPSRHALTSADRRLIRPTAHSRRYVLVEVTAPSAPRARRAPPVNLAFVIDRSGSMWGEKIELAKPAVREALATLDGARPLQRRRLRRRRRGRRRRQHATPPEARRNAIDRLRDDRRPRQHEPRRGWLRGCEQVAEHLDRRTASTASCSSPTASPTRASPTTTS